MWLSKFLKLEKYSTLFKPFFKKPFYSAVMPIYCNDNTTNKLPKLFSQSDEKQTSDSKYQWQQN